MRFRIGPRGQGGCAVGEADTCKGKRVDVRSGERFRVFEDADARHEFEQRQREGADDLLERVGRVQSDSWELAGRMKVGR